MLKLKFFNSIMEAKLAQNLLQENGIVSIIKNSGVRFPGDMGDSFGAEIYVSEKDLEEAKMIIDF